MTVGCPGNTMSNVIKMPDKKIKFEATVRANKTPIGNYGRIVAKELIEFIGKKMKFVGEVVEEDTRKKVNNMSEETQLIEQVKVPKKRGRPFGSKNKPKANPEPKVEEKKEE